MDVAIGVFAVYFCMVITHISHGVYVGEELTSTCPPKMCDWQNICPTKDLEQSEICTRQTRRRVEADR